MTNDQATSQTNCHNCGHMLDGQFCSRCGQKHIPSRLTVKSLAVSAFASFLDVDSAIWKTLRELVRNPGQVAINYIGGQRYSYLNPVKFCLTAFTLYLAVLVMTGTLAELATSAAQPPAEVATSANQAEIGSVIKSVFQDYANIVTFIVIPIFALVVRWQFWRARRNYAETLSFVCFVSGLSYLVGLICILALYLFDIHTNGPKNIVALILFMYGARVFFAMPWWKAVPASILSALAYMIISQGAVSLLVQLRIWHVF